MVELLPWLYGRGGKGAPVGWVAGGEGGTPAGLGKGAEGWGLSAGVGRRGGGRGMQGARWKVKKLLVLLLLVAMVMGRWRRGSSGVERWWRRGPSGGEVVAG